MELRAIENLLKVGGPYFDKNDSDNLMEMIATYLRGRINRDRSWKKYSYRVEIDEGYIKIRVMQIPDNKGSVYI